MDIHFSQHPLPVWFINMGQQFSDTFGTSANDEQPSYRSFDYHSQLIERQLAGNLDEALIYFIRAWKYKQLRDIC